MKQVLVFIVVFFVLVSCKKDPDPVIDYCGDAIAEFKNHVTYEGLFSFCNAQPPLQSFIYGTVSTTILDSNTVIFNLRADSIDFDTSLQYDINCLLLEEVIPSIRLTGQTANDKGWYSHGNFIKGNTGSIHINFGYPNCLNNTAFEGLSK